MPAPWRWEKGMLLPRRGRIKLLGLWPEDVFPVQSPVFQFALADVQQVVELAGYGPLGEGDVIGVPIQEEEIHAGAMALGEGDAAAACHEATAQKVFAVKRP